jgi:hypothetical protein
MWTKIPELNHILSELHYYIIIYRHGYPDSVLLDFALALCRLLLVSCLQYFLCHQVAWEGSTVFLRASVYESRGCWWIILCIRQNTDTTHPTHPDSNVRASSIVIQVGKFQRHPAVSTDQFPSHLVDISISCVNRSPGRVPPSFAGFILWESSILMDYFAMEVGVD